MPESKSALHPEIINNATVSQLNNALSSQIQINLFFLRRQVN
ncbi:hypothetical protein FB99_39090 (plasmid) [Pantoea agglomerans]|nr:hypothetical protein FB99_39090 [Pantoea agglomerans]